MSQPPAFDLEDDDVPKRPAPPPFDITPDAPPPAAVARPSGWLQRVGCFGALPLVLLLLKLGSASKILLPLLSFFATIWLYTKLIPGGAFWLIFGIFLMIFFHECGHAFAARRFGLKYEGMLFTPFGGVVFHRPGNTHVVQDAYIGIMGPVVGGLCAIVATIIAHLAGQPFFFGLGAACFAINLANLVPGGPLDGGWIGGLVIQRSLSPRYASVVAEGKAQSYFGAATQADRVKYGFAWFGLALFLLFGCVWCRFAPYYVGR